MLNIHFMDIPSKKISHRVSYACFGMRIKGNPFIRYGKEAIENI